jgi:hypothetical protein
MFRLSVQLGLTSGLSHTLVPARVTSIHHVAAGEVETAVALHIHPIVGQHRRSKPAAHLVSRRQIFTLFNIMIPGKLTCHVKQNYWQGKLLGLYNSLNNLYLPSAGCENACLNVRALSETQMRACMHSQNTQGTLRSELSSAVAWICGHKSIRKLWVPQWGTSRRAPAPCCHPRAGTGCTWS